MNTPANREAVGLPFTLSGMRHARAQTFDAVHRIAAGIRPGMSEQQACDVAQLTLEQMGMERLWHQIIVRFGPSTLKIFKERIAPQRLLGSNDIFFIDLGVVWQGHEGDAGATFVVGEDSEMQACARAAQTLWRDVAARWRADGLSGDALYQYAAQRATEMGWTLNLDIRGHRVSDFPHAIYRAGSLGDYSDCPNSGLWVLEIQIAHPTRPFGAFYEDLLIAD